MIDEQSKRKNYSENETLVANDDTELVPDHSLEETVSGKVNMDETIVGDVPMTMVTNDLHISPTLKRPFLEVAYRCHLGNVRTRNEDSLYVFQAASGGELPLVPFGLYVVADGMGGHHAGHEASKKAVTILAREVLDRIYLPSLHGRTGTTSTLQEPISEVMLGAVQYANQEIHNPTPEKEGGTTTTAALILGRRLYIVHVGDSRAYLISDGDSRPVTTDHSYVRRLIDAGQLTEEEAAVHPQRNMLYRAVGQGGKLEIDTFTQTLSGKGRLVLCSDGLWGSVPKELMERELGSNGSLQATADSLVEFALMAGGHDNISIIIVNYSY